MNDDLIAEARKMLATTNNFYTAEAQDLVIDLIARLEAAEAKLARMKEALIWCSGSEDFQDGGKAREGWLKLCAPLVWREEDGK